MKSKKTALQGDATTTPHPTDTIKILEGRVAEHAQEIASQKNVIQRLRDTCSRHDRLLQEEKRRTEEVAMRLSWAQSELERLQGKWYVRLFGR